MCIVNFIFVSGGHPSQQKSGRFLLARMHPWGELPGNSQGEGFCENHVFAITRVTQMDPQVLKGVNTFPTQGVTGNGKAQIHWFWSQRVFGGSHFWSLREFGSLLARKTAAFPHILLLSELANPLILEAEAFRRFAFEPETRYANFDSLLAWKNTLFTGVLLRTNSTFGWLWQSTGVVGREFRQSLGTKKHFVYKCFYQNEFHDFCDSQPSRISTVSWNEKTLCLQLFLSERNPRFLPQSTVNAKDKKDWKWN